VNKIKVMVMGANGKMGREVIKAIYKEPDIELVGAIDLKPACDDPVVLECLEKSRLKIEKEFIDSLAEVVVDFTHPEVIFENAKKILGQGKKMVIGTTGLSQEQLKELENLTGKNKTACLVAPNFAIGAVLMMKFAEAAAKFMDSVEIIELHHDKKADAPSGTALITAQKIAASLADSGKSRQPIMGEKVTGVRGGDLNGIKIHSVRLPGLVAHQEVIFGGLGQTLTIRHDSLSRESFMPGVIMAIKKIVSVTGFYHGLEKLL
jgi:4-hydroxy-tetrahydrodipicolinate reductase